MNIDLSSLSTDDLIALKSRLDGLTDVSGRSPLRPRQLHNLTDLPSADDPRPTFFWSADAPRNAGNLTRTTPFPALRWNAEGREVTASDAKALATYTAQGFTLTYPPFAVELDPMDVLAAQLDALSEGDRAALIESQRQDRITGMRKKLGELSEEKLAILLAQSEKPSKRKSA